LKADNAENPYGGPWSVGATPVDPAQGEDAVREAEEAAVGEASGYSPYAASTAAGTAAGRMEPGREAEPGDMFSYHKDLWPLDGMDCLSFFISAVGLMIAAGGGIGGGGILVPVFMIFLKFRPKHAIALSNFTILGGSIANTVFNAQMTSSLIDWDIIVMMEPATIAGAVVGSFASKGLPDFMLSVALASVLSLLSYRTLDKGARMFQRESEELAKRSGGAHELIEGTHSDDEEGMAAETELEADGDGDGDGLENEDDEHEGLVGGSGGGSGHGSGRPQPERGTPWGKIGLLTCCFAGCVVLTILKGGGRGSIIGVTCGSPGFWLISFATIPWIMLFGALFRKILITENYRRQDGRNKFESTDIRWDAKTTIRYPLICTIAGVFAGLFGVGGGIIKGPLMLEMGVNPLVAAATASTMILFTSSAACASFQVFGLLEPSYGVACFILGFVSTLVGQGSINAWMKSARRQSPPVLSIGLVTTLSTVTVVMEAFSEFSNHDLNVLIQPSSICSSFD
jgi:uncharacterized membrane protein YfcA